MKIELKEIGARIEAIIKSAGMSRAELGALLGVKEGAIGRQIRGETDPGTIALAKIAEIGGISLDQLITGKESPKAELISNDDVLYLALASKPQVLEKVREKVKEEIREEQEEYANERRHRTLSEEEHRLIEAYQHASEEIRDEAFGMLERSARRSREKEGGGSDSKAGNCA